MVSRIRFACLIATLAAGVTASAQTQWTPSPAPSVSAADRTWYRERAPIQFAGDRYYPAGARTHFDPDAMVQTGSFDGIPLYADTTVEPFSEVLVPTGGGLLQPYQRRRTGDLAGTSGSRVSELPRDLVPWEEALQARQAITPLTADQPRGRWEFIPAPAYPAPDEQPVRGPVTPGRMQTIREPEDNRGIWISYEGTRWSIAGPAVLFDAGRFSQIGSYHGFPVYATQGASELYIPAWPGMLAVYGRRQ